MRNLEKVPTEETSIKPRTILSKLILALFVTMTMIFVLVLADRLRGLPAGCWPVALRWKR